jgi:hypothetical protein
MKNVRVEVPLSLTLEFTVCVPDDADEDYLPNLVAERIKDTIPEELRPSVRWLPENIMIVRTINPPPTPPSIKIIYGC